MDLVSGKVVAGCSNAGNPFHECSAICLERLNSAHLLNKDKKLFGFGKRTPSSPARGRKSPLPSYFSKKSDTDTSPSTDHTNGNFFSRLSQLQGLPKNDVDSLPGYSGGDYFARRTDQYDDMSPRPFGIRPKTPQHRSDIRPWPYQEDPISLETRPRTPQHESSVTERRPQTPETRPRTPEHQSNTSDTRSRTAQYRGRSPEFMARSPGPGSRTSEPQPTYFEPSSKTPEPSPRIPQTQPISHRSLDSAVLQMHWTVETRPRMHERSPDHREKMPQTQQTSIEMGQIMSSQAYNYLGSKAESVYIEKDDESVLLYPQLILSPQERPPSRPITPSRRGYETPTKQEEHFDQLDESASSDDDKFSFVDDHEDNSVWLYPEVTPKSGSNTPVHHKSRKSPREQDKQNNEPPELPDESQSFSLSERIVRKNETRDEIHSILSESYVSVGDYKVRASVSATLQQILEKHGDIASASKLQSLATRSYYLDMLASVVFQLQTTPLKHLKENRVVEMLAIVRDVESVQIKAGWLKPVMEEIVEAVKHYDQHKMSIKEKDVWEGDVLLARQEIEKQGKELREKEKKMKEWRDRMTEMAAKMGALDIWI